MSVMAAGMESDHSDSEYDMIFNHEKPSNCVNEVKSHKNPNLDFVAVSSETASANGSFVPIAETLPNLPQPKSNYSRNQPKTENRNKQIHSVVHKNQTLDDLRYAAIRGKLDVVKTVIEQGVKVDYVLKSGWTGLMYACSSAQDEIVQYFLEKGADPNFNKDFFTPLMAVCAASKHQDPKLLKCCLHLLKYEAKVNVHERHLTTPLMFAAREGHFQIIQELLKAGADVKKQDNRGKTALMWAVSNGYGQIVRLFLNNGANPDDIDLNGQTAADLAIHYDYMEIAALLEKSSSVMPGNLSETKIEVTDAVIKEKKLESKFFPQNSSSRQQQNSRCYSRKDELDMFLRGLGVPDLIETVKEHQLTFYQLINLNEKELEIIGIDKIGIRKKIIEASQVVQKEKWKQSSLPNMKQLPYISCPDAVGMIANIVNHLKHISCEIVYIRLQIQAEPKILELAQDTANVHNLVKETDNGIQKVQTLFNELQFLKLHLHKVQGNTQYIPADLIENVKNDQSIWRTKIVFGVFIISVTIGGILWKKPESLAHINSLIISKISYLK